MPWVFISICDIHLRAISQWVLFCITMMSLKIVLIKLLPHLPGTNELMGKVGGLGVVYEGHKHPSQSLVLWNIQYRHISGLVQERRNSIADALELCLSCTNRSILDCDKTSTNCTKQFLIPKWSQYDYLMLVTIGSSNGSPSVSLPEETLGRYLDAIISWHHWATMVLTDSNSRNYVFFPLYSWW